MGKSVIGKNNTADRTLYDNKRFEETNFKVKLYVHESEFPILESSPKGSLSQIAANYNYLDNEELGKSPTVWLGFCLDGQYGTLSARSLDRFWKEDGLDGFWSKSSNSQRDLPSSEVCEMYYKAHPLVE